MIQFYLLPDLLRLPKNSVFLGFEHGTSRLPVQYFSNVFEFLFVRKFANVSHCEVLKSMFYYCETCASEYEKRGSCSSRRKKCAEVELLLLRLYSQLCFSKVFNLELQQMSTSIIIFCCFFDQSPGC